MDVERKKHECPFLKEEKVVFCKAFPLKKILPLERIFEKENICLKREHVSCPVYLEKMMDGLPQSKVCHYLGTENIIFCQLSPIKKMIPLYSLKFEGPCSNRTYESCPLYQKMVEGDEKAANIQGFSLEDALYYHTNHVWLRRLNGHIRIGLDDFGQFVLGDIKEITFPKLGEKIKVNKPFITFTCVDGLIDLPSPVDGVVVNINSAVYKNNALINLDPYGDGWLLEIKPTEKSGRFEEKATEIFHGDAACSWLEKDIDRLRHFMESEIGVTVADGGEIWRGLRDTVGKKGSLLVKIFFGKKRR